MSERRKILIVDDDPVFVKSTSLVLEAHGYDVDSARNGAEGLAKIKQDPPDLVLLDVMMSYLLEGVEVSRQMMTQRGVQDIPIIMVTSILDTEYREVFPLDQYLHIHSWLNKPVAPDDLVAEVERALPEANEE
jgi:two-component system alkaline phosphatase synthesis response regulator PhoP